MEEKFFAKEAIRRLVKKYAPEALITEEATTEIKRILEETGQALIIEAHTYTKASKRKTIKDTDVKNAKNHVLKM